jgi:SAM-dependent methyltransferase
MTGSPRQGAFGKRGRLTPVDRFGIWLSARRIATTVPDLSGLRIGDFGCGYNAAWVRTVLDRVATATLIDLELAPDLKAHAKVTAIEGRLPDALAGLADGTLDLVTCTSVLEHLDDPLGAIVAFKRLCAPGGVVLLNVPSWRGKWFLEFSAFRLGLSPAEEMDDHKMYYDPRDLWPLLVKAGFRPRHLKVFTHKFGLNTFAVCRNGPLDG